MVITDHAQNASQSWFGFRTCRIFETPEDMLQRITWADCVARKTTADESQKKWADVFGLFKKLAGYISGKREKFEDVPSAQTNSISDSNLETFLMKVLIVLERPRLELWVENCSDSFNFHTASGTTRAERYEGAEYTEDDLAEQEVSRSLPWVIPTDRDRHRLMGSRFLLISKFLMAAPKLKKSP